MNFGNHPYDHGRVYHGAPGCRNTCQIFFFFVIQSIHSLNLHGVFLELNI